jgi:hypothetical protein
MTPKRGYYVSLTKDVCFICGAECSAEYVRYAVHSMRDGKEFSRKVCPVCNQNFVLAAEKVVAGQIEVDRVNG